MEMTCRANLAHLALDRGDPLLCLTVCQGGEGHGTPVHACSTSSRANYLNNLQLDDEEEEDGEYERYILPQVELMSCIACYHAEALAMLGEAEYAQKLLEDVKDNLAVCIDPDGDETPVRCHLPFTCSVVSPKLAGSILSTHLHLIHLLGTLRCSPICITVCERLQHLHPVADRCMHATTSTDEVLMKSGQGRTQSQSAGRARSGSLRCSFCQRGCCAGIRFKPKRRAHKCKFCHGSLQSSR